MNLFKPFLSILVAGVSLAAAYLAAADQDSGLIGKRYFGADLTFEHFHTPRLNDTLGGSGLLNLPLAPGYDAALAYGAAHVTGNSYSLVQQAFSATAIAYNQDDYGKPYFSATLGHAWDTTRTFGIKTHDNDNFWALGVGLEAPCGHTSAINYGLSYSDSFDRHGRNPAWQYSVQANHWFTDMISGIASISYNQIKSAPDALLYTVGVRVLF